MISIDRQPVTMPTSRGLFSVPDSRAVLGQHEDTQRKRVSRLLATFIAPTIDQQLLLTKPTLPVIHDDHHRLPSSSTIIHTTTAATINTTTETSHRERPGATVTKGPLAFYPTVAPESVVIPIVSSIIGFPILALLVICCLRKRAKMARERDRRRNYDTQDHNANMVRFGQRLNGRNSRTLSVCSERSISWAYPSMDLDTVYEERDQEPHRDKY